MNEQHAAELWLLIQLPHPMDIVAMCPMHVIVWSREGKKHRFSVGLAEVKPENAGNLVDVELLGVNRNDVLRCDGTGERIQSVAGV